MKITVLDGYTLNPGDLNWDALRALGEVQIFDRTRPEETLPRAAGSALVLTNKVVLNQQTIGSLPELKYIGVLATGTNVVDLAAARSRGVVVTNVPAYGSASVAQATIALLLEVTNHVGRHSDSVRAGNWSKNVDWCYWDTPLIELSGLTMGIVGLGRIGLNVAQIASALGMQVIGLARTPRSLPEHVAPVKDLPALLGQSDVVSLHVPLTSETERLINAKTISLMKPGAILLNTSRGGLLDEGAVAEALNSGRLGGAGLDVLSTEPPRLDNPLVTARNCVITPHQAWGTRAARQRLMDVAVANVRAFLDGKPQNIVG